MFKWLKRLFKDDEEEFNIRVGNGPEQTGTAPGTGVGYAGSAVLKDATERLNAAVDKAEAEKSERSSEPIVWAPVNTTITPEPAADVSAEDKRTEWNKSQGFTKWRGIDVVDAPKPKKERKPKKLNKGLAAKAKKAKTKAPKRKK